MQSIVGCKVPESGYFTSWTPPPGYLPLGITPHNVQQLSTAQGSGVLYLLWHSDSDSIGLTIYDSGLRLRAQNQNATATPVLYTVWHTIVHLRMTLEKFKILLIKGAQYKKVQAKV